MPFDRKKCVIPTVWCGDGKMPSISPKDSIYVRPGTRYECLRKGFGLCQVKSRSIKPTSVQNIRYVGDTYEKNFKKNGISSLDKLVTEFKKYTKKEKERILIKVFTKKGGSFDLRSFNSTILFLHDNKVKNLPTCIDISI
ncbi:hypothetical protein OAG24_00095 [bacterium]|nr:hypothetical protein [bacterium]